jgi:Protein of unknown function (DUF4235)
MAKHTDLPGTADGADEKNAGKLGYKIMTGAAAAVGTTVARKALDTGWRATTGRKPPEKPEHPDVRWGEAAAWAVGSAAIAALFKLLAQRRIAATWRRASGELPPGLDQPHK